MKTNTLAELKLELQSGEIKQIDKRVVVVRITAQAKNVNQARHTALLLDCSGSMAGSLEDVKKDSQSFVDGLDENDYVSIFVFSGHNSARLIAGPTACNILGKTMVKAAIRDKVCIMNTTVFSEPLGLALREGVRHLDALQQDTFTHNVVLFTDGCAVPTEWSFSTEQNKALQVARELQSLGNAALSVVGYGVYYDDLFMRNLMRESGYVGLYMHVSEIDDFAAAVQEIRNVFSKVTMVPIDLTFTPNKGSAGRIFRTTPELFLMGDGGRVKGNGLYENEVTLFVELSHPSSNIRVSGFVGNETVEQTLSGTALSDENVAAYVRVLGAYAFLSGDTAYAAELLQLIGDDGLAEKAGMSFTTRESRETGQMVRQMFRDKKFIGSGLKPTGPNHCVLNALRVLIEDEGNVVFIGKNGYKRSGELTSDPRVIHPPTRTLKVMGYRSHESRLNFSLLTLKDVKVLPESGDGPPEDRKIWRTYNIILDGNLHMSELEAVLSEESFVTLQEAGVVGENETYSRTKTYTLNFRNLKMISGVWANPRTLGLVSLLQEEADLEAEQTALNAQCKKLKVAGISKSDGDIYFPKEKKVEGVVTESYSGKCVEIRLMKYKARSYDVSSMKYEEADKRVKQVRQRLIVVRYIIRAITFAMEMTDSRVIPWGVANITKKGEYSKTEQSANFGGAELKRVKWEEQFVCS